MGRWPARIALLICCAMVAVIMGSWTAIGGPGGFLVSAFQTATGSPTPTRTGSPTASPSGSPTRCAIPLPPTCPSPRPTASSTPTASPTASPTATPPGGETERHGSRVSIRFNDARAVFKGAVRSASKCERLREVVLRRVREGRDPIVGRDNTNREGKWRVRLPGANGRFYAKVLKRAFQQGETRVVCQAGRSRTITARTAP